VLGRFSRSMPPRATLRTSRSRRSTSDKLMIVIALRVLVGELAIDDGTTHAPHLRFCMHFSLQ
jgi:hypothetical protein